MSFQKQVLTLSNYLHNLETVHVNKQCLLYNHHPGPWLKKYDQTQQFTSMFGK